MIELDLRLPLDRFALEVRARLEADSTVLFGPSGSGKTSLLEAIAGLRRRAVGRIVLDGEVLLDTSAGVRVAPERRGLGYVPQDGALFPHLTARENIAFALRSGDGRRVDELAALLEIAPLLSRYPATLSGGERQRVALARALAASPRLLLLDEPLAALDVALKERILPYLLRVRDVLRISMLCVTHQLGEALALGREALVLREGRVEAQGAAAEVLSIGRVEALEPGARIENVLDGVLEAEDETNRTRWLRLAGGGRLAVPQEPGLVAGARASYTVPAEDLLLATHPLTGISARNVLEGAVVQLDATGFDVFARVEAAGARWHVKLTPGAVRELGLEQGSKVWLVAKAQSLRRLH